MIFKGRVNKEVTFKIGELSGLPKFGYETSPYTTP